MITFQIRGADLFDSHHRRVATSRGTAIYDGNNQRVATIRGDVILDTDDRTMATLRGTDIFDATSTKVGSLSDVQRSIKGSVVGALHAALWYCFVR